MRRAVAAAAVLLALALPAAGLPAAAAPTPAGTPQGRIDDLDADRAGALAVTFSAGLGGRNVALRPDSVRVRLADGTELAPQAGGGTTNGTTGATTGPVPSVVLVLDTSGSMVDPAAGIDRMRPMKAAARQFLQQLDPRVQVGLVTFGDPAVIRARFGTSRPELMRKIDALRPEGDTALFAAAAQAARMLAHRNGSRSILMLTDGQNEPLTTKDRTTGARVSRLLAADENSPIRFSALLIRSTKPDPQLILRGLEHATGRTGLGTVERTDDANLQDVLDRTFTATKNDIELQQTGVFTVPPRLAGREQNVTVTATLTDGTAVEDQRAVRFADAARPTVAAAPAGDGDGPVVGTPVMVIGLAALFLALATLLAVVTGAASGPREATSEVLRRLEVYSVAGPQPDRVAVREQTITTRLGDNPLTRSAVTLMTHLARRSRLDSALDGRLEAAGLPLRTAEWMLLHVGAAVGGGLLLLVLGAGRAAPTLLGLLLGLAAPWAFLLVARGRRRSRFLGQLPDTLQLLAGSLAAGYSLPQAMDAVVRESATPIKDEFNRALIEARLGMPPEDALEGIARRTASEDFSWIVLAIRIQRDVGGNLAELLTTVAGTLRDRERLRRQVSALSAEGKLSGAILGALPVVFGGYLLLSRPEYIAPLFSTPMGLALLVTGGVLLAVGGVWMAKMIRVDV